MSFAETCFSIARTTSFAPAQATKQQIHLVVCFLSHSKRDAAKGRT
jgi:hypothetical protein